ncbi:glycosyltransferase [Rhizobium rhododendri]|uniref:Glycosyltransferase n=1 Tax=Rhizobium rhododendri TaxID=2506430 RepID=A0ABY8IPJ6_9HYPH|nr:glycosyltransferase [Rhizobium rhododendri]WFS25226.1 glycosyltransferase [Rhizobium rhododendri]
MARIDVLLPVRNGEEFLEESILSIVNQTFQDWKLWILDHGSVDSSLKIAERFAERDRRIHIRSIPEANSLADLLNRGLDQSDADLIMRHDADDIAVPARMNISLSGLAHYECAVIGGQSKVIDNVGRHIGHLRVPTGKNAVSARVYFANPMSHPTIMMSREKLQLIGARYGVDFLGTERSGIAGYENLVEDYFMFGQLAVVGECANVPNTLISYRQHPASVGATKFKEQITSAVNVSRQLMRAFCFINNVQYIDPAPFSTHGERLPQLAGSWDLESDVGRLGTLLRSKLGKSAEVEREIAYRNSLATLTLRGLLVKQMHFAFIHGLTLVELRTLREKLFRNRAKGNYIQLSPEKVN